MIPAPITREINSNLGLDPNRNILSEEHLRTSLDSSNNKSYENENTKSFFSNLEHDFVTVICSKCGDNHRVQIPCGYRSCPSCSKNRVVQRRIYLENKFSGILSKHDLNHSLRELTLTFKNVKCLSGWIDTFHGWVTAFRRSFRENDKLKWYNIDGGCGNIEITRNLVRQDWHIHVHMPLEGNYIPQKIIKAQWNKITGGRGNIVDIRKITNSRKSSYEIAKYSTKPHNIDKWSFREVMEFENAVHSKRLFFTFGTWYGDKVYSNDKTCGQCGALNSLVVLEFIDPDYADYLINTYEIDYG